MVYSFYLHLKVIDRIQDTSNVIKVYILTCFQGVKDIRTNIIFIMHSRNAINVQSINDSAFHDNVISEGF